MTTLSAQTQACVVMSACQCLIPHQVLMQWRHQGTEEGQLPVVVHQVLSLLRVGIFHTDAYVGPGRIVPVSDHGPQDDVVHLVDIEQAVYFADSYLARVDRQRLVVGSQGQRLLVSLRQAIDLGGVLAGASRPLPGLVARDHGHESGTRNEAGSQSAWATTSLFKRQLKTHLPHLPQCLKDS